MVAGRKTSVLPWAYTQLIPAINRWIFPGTAVPGDSKRCSAAKILLEGTSMKFTWMRKECGHVDIPSGRVVDAR